MTMGIYNLTTLMNDFSLTGGLIEINRQANMILGILLIVGIFILLFWSMKNFESTRAFAYSSFVTTVLSVIAYEIGLIPLYVVIILILLTVGSAVMLQTEGG
jgi:hypothetical protein